MAEKKKAVKIDKKQKSGARKNPERSVLSEPPPIKNKPLPKDLAGLRGKAEKRFKKLAGKQRDFSSRDGRYLLSELETHQIELVRANEELEKEIVERIKTEKAMLEQSRKLEAYFKHSVTPLVFLDKEFNFIRVNDAYAKACAREVADFAGHNYFVDYPSDELKGKFARAVETKEQYSVFSRPFVFPDHPEWGTTCWDLFLYPVLDINGEVDFLVFALHDVTERMRAEEGILRLTRLYSVLSKVNETIVRVKEPDQLFREICRIAVEDGHFKMAWIGLLDPETLEVKPVERWGDTGGYLQKIRVVAADVPEGKGPTGRAILEGHHVICTDIEHDPLMLPWRDKALEHGFRSSAALPIRAGSRVIGAFTTYSSTPQFFTGEEINLLSSLAEDIAFAIESGANEKKRLEAEDALRRLNEELEQKVIDRTVKLESANKELEAFSYSVSHDLKAPVRIIDGFSRILLEDHADNLDDIGKNLLKLIRGNTKKMDELIGGLLALSHAGRQELRISVIDMKGLARSVFEELKAGDQERKIKCEIGTLPSVQGDHVLIRTVFTNLLSNAIKFTGRKDKAVLEVGGGSEGDENIYYVKDNGAGFNMEYADKLFGVFQRLHSSKEFEGTGVGLSIVRRIIQRHGGRVWADSKVNEGTTIYFALPK